MTSSLDFVNFTVALLNKGPNIIDGNMGKKEQTINNIARRGLKYTKYRRDTSPIIIRYKLLNITEKYFSSTNFKSILRRDRIPSVLLFALLLRDIDLTNFFL